MPLGHSGLPGTVYSSSLVEVFSGLLGALVWKGVYLYELGHNLNWARVLADWVVDLFARPDTSKFMED
jgi:NADH dehydrogenase FAD-containing subunit